MTKSIFFKPNTIISQFINRFPSVSRIWNTVIDSQGLRSDHFDKLKAPSAIKERSRFSRVGLERTRGEFE